MSVAMIERSYGRFSPRVAIGNWTSSATAMTPADTTNGARIGLAKPETLGDGSRLCGEKPRQDKASPTGFESVAARFLKMVEHNEITGIFR